MKNTTILKTGVTGSVITAICCFTPILAIVLGVAGLSAWLGWIDYVLFPLLAIFLGLTAYGLWHRRHAAARCATETQKSEETT